jgi:hypothetical protein
VPSVSPWLEIHIEARFPYSGYNHYTGVLPVIPH